MPSQVLTVPANDFDLSKVNGTNQSVSFQKVSSFSSKPGTPIKCEASSSIAPTPGEDSVEPAFSVPEAHVSSTAYVVFYRKLSDFGPPAGRIKHFNSFQSIYRIYWSYRSGRREGLPEDGVDGKIQSDLIDSRIVEDDLA